MRFVNKSNASRNEYLMRFVWKVGVLNSNDEKKKIMRKRN